MSKTEYRQLEPAEAALVKKGIRKFEEEIEYHKYIAEHAQLMLTKGLKANYELQMSEYRVTRRCANKKVDELQHQITELKIQLTDGVKKK